MWDPSKEVGCYVKVTTLVKFNFIVKYFKIFRQSVNQCVGKVKVN